MCSRERVSESDDGDKQQKHARTQTYIQEQHGIYRTLEIFTKSIWEGRNKSSSCSWVQRRMDPPCSWRTSSVVILLWILRFSSVIFHKFFFLSLVSLDESLLAQLAGVRQLRSPSEHGSVQCSQKGPGANFILALS